MNQFERVREAQAGNHTAFLSLIEEQQDRLYRIAYYYVRQEMDAEDVVHETIYRALVGLPKLKQPQFFTTWLTRIVMNCAMTALNKRQRLVVDDRYVDELQQVSVKEHDDRIDLLAAVDQLEPRQRQVIAFKYWQDMTIEEIANLLRMPSGTVKTILHRGLKALRKNYSSTEGAIRSESASVSEQDRLQQRLVALKQLAEARFHIPQSHELTIADYQEDKREAGRAVFVWTKQGADPVWGESGKDTGMSLVLGSQEELLEYTIDVEEAARDLPVISQEELRLRGEEFVLIHYPTALKGFSLTRTKATESGTIFFYEQVVMDLPLPSSGFRVTVHQSGMVSDFHYFGMQKKPKIPEKLMEKEQILKHIEKTVKVDLQLTYVPKYVLNRAQDELRLVYELDNCWMSYPADEHEAPKVNEETVEWEEEAVWLPVPVLPKSEVVRTLEEIQTLLGINPKQYQLLRSADIDEEISAFVWRRRDWKSTDSDDRSFRTFFQTRSAGTVKVIIHKRTGALVSFSRFEDCPPGEKRLSREECLDIALQLVARTRPELEPYLWLRQQEEEEESDREQFEFRIGVQGVWLKRESLRIVVNKTTGLLEGMDGSFIDTTQLETVQTTPLIDERKALQIYREALDLKLEWQTDYSGRGKNHRYRLVYRQVHRDKQREMQWIDARTGELI
ncbi:sigma-70 family RNA polymerase sigma factor [Brevibacillus sp. BC25]|uniref:sigma-70 family RNA polymerase sigma factor n=1 Tax=Brevibacillus sp. BC25 TaxID=1144308 RepID=UPI000270E5BB|nr:sigma-70 family RNA polymerase sigma factor [Brevibacillus sp. BC25]EJL26780.1 RNA polymerase sigma factor, sigma-70 family [Brevibacillus sp. BC25]